MRRITALIIAAAFVAACDNTTAPTNLIEPCDTEGTNPDTCGPKPAPKDSAYVCRVSIDNATGQVTGEWCGWIYL